MSLIDVTDDFDLIDDVEEVATDGKNLRQLQDYLFHNQYMMAKKKYKKSKSKKPPSVEAYDEEVISHRRERVEAIKSAIVNYKGDGHGVADVQAKPKADVGSSKTTDSKGE